MLALRRTEHEQTMTQSHGSILVPTATFSRFPWLKSLITFCQNSMLVEDRNRHVPTPILALNNWCWVLGIEGRIGIEGIGIGWYCGIGSYWYWLILTQYQAIPIPNNSNANQHQYQPIPQYYRYQSACPISNTQHQLFDASIGVGTCLVFSLLMLTIKGALFHAEPL